MNDSPVIYSATNRNTWIAPFKFLFLLAEDEDSLTGSDWVGPLIIVVITTMAIQAAITPLATSLLDSVSGAANLTPEQQAHAVSIFRATRYISLAVMPFSIPLKILMSSWITYMIAVVMGIRVTFRQIFIAFCVAALVPALCNVIQGVVAFIYTPTRMDGLMPPLGINAFISIDNKILNALLGGFSIISIWRFTVIVFCLTKNAKMTFWRAVSISLPMGFIFPAIFDIATIMVTK